MTLRAHILSLAAPFALAVAWDTICLAARLMSVLKALEDNRAEAMAHVEKALADHMAWQAEQSRRAA